MLTGGALARASAYVFLPPLAGAVLGAALTRQVPGIQFPAVLAGLAAGVLASRLLSRRVRRICEERS